MDVTTQAFVTEIVSRRIAENWLYWLLFLAASFLAAFAGAYIKRRAENLATRDDFNELKRQLEATTRITEDIKAEIGHREWKAREVNALKRVKLEEFLETLTQSLEELSTYVRKSCSGEFADKDDTPLARVEMLASLYFPSMRVSTLDFVQACHVLGIWAIDRSKLYRAVPESNLGERQRLHAESVVGVREKYPLLLKQKSSLESLAREEMERLLAVEVGD